MGFKPFRQTPFFQLHPCHTENWMEMVFKNSDIPNKLDNYLVQIL